MPKYTALTPIKHDGKRYAVGATIDLNKAEADALPDGTVELPRTEDAAARKAGVPAPLIPMPSPAQGSTRSPTPTQRSTRPMGGVAPAPAWQGGTAWGITSTVEQATSSKETAE